MEIKNTMVGEGHSSTGGEKDKEKGQRRKKIFSTIKKRGFELGTKVGEKKRGLEFQDKKKRGGVRRRGQGVKDRNGIT